MGEIRADLCGKVTNNGVPGLSFYKQPGTFIYMESFLNENSMNQQVK